MRKLVFIPLFILAFGLSQIVSAATPVSCVPVKMISENKNIMLAGPEKSAPSQIYFFKNTTKQAIWIDHPTNRSMNAGWSSYVRPGNWSAFLLNRKAFAISCTVIQPGKVDTLECAKAISVCMPKQVTFKTSPKGTYWLAEDKSWEEIVKAVEKRGVTLK